MRREKDGGKLVDPSQKKPAVPDFMWGIHSSIATDRLKFSK
jgi:hypothetical protein